MAGAKDIVNMALTGGAILGAVGLGKMVWDVVGDEWNKAPEVPTELVSKDSELPPISFNALDSFNAPIGGDEGGYYGIIARTEFGFQYNADQYKLLADQDPYYFNNWNVEIEADIMTISKGFDEILLYTADYGALPQSLSKAVISGPVDFTQYASEGLMVQISPEVIRSNIASSNYPISGVMPIRRVARTYVYPVYSDGVNLAYMLWSQLSSLSDAARIAGGNLISEIRYE